MTQAPRFSELPLPPYRFVRGETPHPTQDPEGHFQNKTPFRCPELDATNWRQCRGFLFALDLFNHRYWWECHEVLEDLWHELDHTTPTAQFLQAFIQCTIWNPPSFVDT